MGILGIGGMDTMGNEHIRWGMGIFDGRTHVDILSVWENLALGRIRKLACDRREALFLAFLERFQY